MASATSTTSESSVPHGAPTDSFASCPAADSAAPSVSVSSAAAAADLGEATSPHFSAPRQPGDHQDELARTLAEENLQAALEHLQHAQQEVAQALASLNRVRDPSAPRAVQMRGWHGRDYPVSVALLAVYGGAMVRQAIKLIVEHYPDPRLIRNRAGLLSSFLRLLQKRAAQGSDGSENDE